MRFALTTLFFLSTSVFAEPVNINQADAETISKALNGVGPKKAEAIIQYRKEHGDFKTLKDLESVSGIGAKTIQINEKDIIFSESAPAVGSTAEKKSESNKSVETEKKAK